MVINGEHGFYYCASAIGSAALRGEHLAENKANADVVAIAMDINGIPRRLKRPEDWAEFVLTRELSEGDLVRVERRGSEPADMCAGDVPELRAFFDQIKLATTPQVSPAPALLSGETGSSKSEIAEVGDQVGKRGPPDGAPAPKTPPKKKSILGSKPGDTPTAPARPTAAVAATTIAQPKKLPVSSPTYVAPQSPKSGTRTVVGWGIGLLIVAVVLSRIGNQPQSPQHPDETRTPAQNSVTEYASRSVAVRNAPTIAGSILIAMADAGTSFTGDLVTGNSGNSSWLKISEGTYAGDYVWAGNLSQNAPPAASNISPSPPTQLATPSLPETPATTGTINLQSADGSPTPAVASPSFDCTRAKSWQETTICSNPGLIDLDNRMATAYRALIASTAGRERHLLVVSQRQWLEQRAPCAQAPDSVVCLTNLYNGRITELNSTNYVSSLVAADIAQKQPAVTTQQTDILTGTPTILDSATLNINGTVVHLLGIEGIGGDEAQKMSQFIVEQGGTVTCRSDSNAYVCTTPSNLDIAIAALLNGAARLAPNAPTKYQPYELQARLAARGVWANRN